MLSSGTATSITHCIMSRFVLCNKYAEPRGKGGSFFYNGRVKWELAQNQESITFSLKLHWACTKGPQLTNLTKPSGNSSLSKFRSTDPYWNFTNFRIQRVLSTVHSLGYLQITLHSNFLPCLHISPQDVKLKLNIKKQGASNTIGFQAWSCSTSQFVLD